MNFSMSSIVSSISCFASSVIWSPTLTKNTHTILVKSDSSNFKIEIENIQSVENPGTGKITALSVVATLRGMISSLKVGT